MADIDTENPKIKLRSSCFPSCFGFSKESQGMIVSGGRKRSRWFSGSRFRMKNSGTKTVPVDNQAMIVKPNVEKETEAVDSDKITKKRHIPAVIAVVSDSDQNATVDLSKKSQNAEQGVDQSVTEKSRKAKFLDSRKQSHGSVQDDKCHEKLSVSRKSSGNNPSSQSPRGAKSSPPVLSSQSSSFLQPGRSQHVGKKSRKLDPVVGMSVLMVTLAIMLLWGRICAVVCTSAWFYFIPRLRTVLKSSKEIGEIRPADSANPNLDSEEYKKKVILEGLLERNHRSSNGLL